MRHYRPKMTLHLLLLALLVSISLVFAMHLCAGLQCPAEKKLLEVQNVCLVGNLCNKIKFSVFLLRAVLTQSAVLNGAPPF